MYVDIWLGTIYVHPYIIRSYEYWHKDSILQKRTVGRWGRWQAQGDHRVPANLRAPQSPSRLLAPRTRLLSLAAHLRVAWHIYDTTYMCICTYIIYISQNFLAPKISSVVSSCAFVCVMTYLSYYIYIQRNADGFAQSLEIISETLTDVPELCPWNLRVVPGNNRHLSWTPWEFWYAWY